MIQPLSRPSTLSAVPAGVWALGLVSMFMDISSEMIHALLPVYLVTAMGASTLAVGFIEGIAEATANIVKVFSGALSDWLGKRKALAAAGYGLAAITKPVFPLAPTIGWLIAARFVDRVGKGIRGAPRDALVADLTPPEARGAAYGLRQTLDTIGAFLGPLAAIALMAMSGGDFRFVFWIAVIPAFLSLVLILFAVKDPDHAGTAGKPKLRFADVGRLGGAFWLVVGFAALFSLARFSEAFLILDATGEGLPAAFAPAVLVVMNVVYAGVSWPAGARSDTIGRKRFLVAGIAVLAIADLVLALGTGLVVSFAGIALWGLHMGLTQGLLSAMIADAAPAELRGTAFGVFNLVVGIAALVASVLAGWLWDLHGASATFFAGAALAGASLALLLAVRDHRSP